MTTAVRREERLPVETVYKKTRPGGADQTRRRSCRPGGGAADQEEQSRTEQEEQEEQTRRSRTEQEEQQTKRSRADQEEEEEEQTRRSRTEQEEQSRPRGGAADQEEEEELPTPGPPEKAAPVPLTMRPVLLSLLLAALHLHAPGVSSAPHREEAAARRRGLGRVRSVEERRAAAARHHLLQRLLRMSLNHDAGGAETPIFVSMFDLRRKRLLCKEYKREQHNSGEARVSCRLGNIWFDLLGSQQGAEALKPLVEETQRSHKLSSSRRRKKLLLHPLVSRQRRADPVNPSDPLRSESHPSSTREYQDPDPEDQAGAVSKETITSCGDPLRVLIYNPPVSPIKINIESRADVG
ncbi:hypothetical protein CRUP_031570 [Coryphaenoides rupestris]|nr:hypothetical protein CRUP_031570 [Coryphaenoides rupestris]